MTDIDDDNDLNNVREIPAPGARQLPDFCPPGQHYDILQNRCILDSGSRATTTDGIVIPSLPYDSYTLDPIDYNVQSVHKANGSFRENFLRQTKDLNSVVVGGYILCDGPDDEEITGKLGGGLHTSSDGGKAGRCYEINIVPSAT